MIKDLKSQQLKTVIYQGDCPSCSSKEVKYIEYEKAQFFQFECRQCHWHSFYTRGEFEQASVKWSADDTPVLITKD